jgi:hypothetical protein
VSTAALCTPSHDRRAANTPTPARTPLTVRTPLPAHLCALAVRPTSGHLALSSGRSSLAAAVLCALDRAAFKLLGEALEMLSDDFKRKLWDEGYDKEAVDERVRAAERAAREEPRGHHHHHH